MRSVSVALLFLFLLLNIPVASAQNQAPARFRAGVDMVSVRVTVTDLLNRYVVGLERENFRIFEEKVEQVIAHFFDENSSINVGIILDVSGSMKDKLLSARYSVVRFLESGTPDDQYFLATFNERSTVVQDFTSRSENIRSQLMFSSPKGRTALYDAIYVGLEKMREADHNKKALIIISDGEDNSSRYTFSDVKEFAEESDVQIYIIGSRGQSRYGEDILAELGRLTGGRVFFPHDFKQLGYFIDSCRAAKPVCFGLRPR